MIKKLFQMVQKNKIAIDEYIHDGNEEVEVNNIRTLKHVSIIAFILTLFFIGLTPVFIWEWNISIYHITLLAAMPIFAVVAMILEQRKCYQKKLVDFVIVLFMIVLMTMFTAIDTVECPDSAETFMVGFLIIAPIIFIVPMWSVLCFQIIFTVGFIVTVMMTKSERMVGGDCIQAIYGCVVGLVIYFIVMRLRLHEHKQKLLYKTSSEIDFLTQIDNRATSKRKIDQYLTIKDDEKSCAMIVLDVDRFKDVNDKLGHEKGDKVLYSVAATLKQVFRNGDILGRFGGDEFVIFLKDVQEPEFMHTKCVQINEQLKSIWDGELEISCSMGICYLKNGSTESEDMFRIADQALYESKINGRATYRLRELQI